MAVLADILALFSEWPEWRRMREAPARIDALERRLAELEGKAPDPDPSPACVACGAPTTTLTRRVERKLGAEVVGATEIWACATCGGTQTRIGSV